MHVDTAILPRRRCIQNGSRMVGGADAEWWWREWVSGRVSLIAGHASIKYIKGRQYRGIGDLPVYGISSGGEYRNQSGRLEHLASDEVNELHNPLEIRLRSQGGSTTNAADVSSAVVVLVLNEFVLFQEAHPFPQQNYKVGVSWPSQFKRP